MGKNGNTGFLEPVNNSLNYDFYNGPAALNANQDIKDGNYLLKDVKDEFLYEPLNTGTIRSVGKKLKSPTHTQPIRTYEPYSLPGLDYPGPGFEDVRVSYIHVKRPTTFVIDRETTATLQVIRRDGQILFPTRIQDPENPFETWYYNFMLTGIREQRRELAQIAKMFGDSLELNFFGSAPLILVCGGLLLNSDSYKWADQWMDAYERYLKGKKCVENKSRIYLTYNNVVVSGYMLSTANIRESMAPRSIAMTFSFLVVDSAYANIPPLEEIKYNPEEGGEVVQEIELTHESKEELT